MQVFLKTLQGETIPCQISEGQTVAELKQQLAQQFGYDMEHIKLVSEGHVLSEAELLLLALTEESTVYMTAGLDGGKKKKKKKQYTTKKKTKHHHVSVKLATLKFYSVDEKSGQVTHQRKVCPSCSNGYFMAKHYDRHYCGKCHVSFKLDPATIKANLAELQKRQTAKAAVAAETKPAAAAGGAKDKKKKKK
ncbi:Zinc-binding ribosomal protein [Pseudocohnilembus persalinus]|uniref:Zinc-binding ribosomal protein n=1 Tax=Pseudocohnilembus persalinus TaxID=266149 RepID=A0A0V0QD96_PSEPJ|nr:Zinc-binding ribosomal protein [Pseudocohnilembus persalinus]|eukprot:KRX00193.1 Zinc-binding ribosomal protein [Pseudocohnilembus persalinus]